MKSSIDVYGGYDDSAVQYEIRCQKRRAAFLAAYPFLVLAFEIFMLGGLWLGVVWTLLGLLEPDL